MKAKLAERSRQSARECRARKKLRYQYLEELVAHRERAVAVLRREMEQFRLWCRDMDEGRVPEGIQRVLEEARGDSDLHQQMNGLRARTPRPLTDAEMSDSPPT